MDGISNVWAVVVAALASMVIGSLWYGPLFQKPWMKYVGLTRDSIKSMGLTPMQAIAGGFVGAVLTAGVFSWLSDAVMILTAADALKLALCMWLGLAVPLAAGSWLWEGKSAKLFVLNASHYLVSWSVTALIVGLWR